MSTRSPTVKALGSTPAACAGVAPRRGWRARPPRSCVVCPTGSAAPACPPRWPDKQRGFSPKPRKTAVSGHAIHLVAGWPLAYRSSMAKRNHGKKGPEALTLSGSDQVGTLPKHGVGRPRGDAAVLRQARRERAHGPAREQPGHHRRDPARDQRADIHPARRARPCIRGHLGTSIVNEPKPYPWSESRLVRLLRTTQQ